MTVLQYQWLWLALAGGAALVFGMVLYYYAMWRPRAVQPPETTPEAARPLARLRAAVNFTPWLLIVVIVASVVLALAFTILWSIQPPNW